MGARYPSFGMATPPARRAVTAAEAVALLQGGKARLASLLAYGNGRSYGDSCQSDGGAAVDMRALNRIIAFDPRTGLLEAEAGAMLSDVIAFAGPQGFFPQVVPGTQFVTLGGAIANDIHGKNHHRRGSFGAHVAALTLLRSDGRTRRCSPSEFPQLFAATVGGMGLTGLILSASIRLMPVASLRIRETATPFGSLAEYFDLAEAADAANEYAVAWLDQLAGGARAGRGILFAGNHAESGGRAVEPAAPRLAVPFQPPVTVLNRPFLRLFNAAYRFAKRRAGGGSSSYRSFFFPLDGVGGWNRLYGPRGLFQHQSVLPFAGACETVERMLAETRAAGQGSFLTVLKRFGAMRSPGLLSFPRPGYTLTLDFPNRGAPTLDLLSRLDAITVEAGGAVNPYKDARMSPATFAASFPGWVALEALRDPAMMSGFWRRTAMRLPQRADALPDAAE